ncbi:unnamed protein product [Linum trigynum]|uniref:Secreted protein n=1 Tax=Linum trigynum TaxID=586398 RepID=A0AAV2GKW1_9ROSI
MTKTLPIFLFLFLPPPPPPLSALFIHTFHLCRLHSYNRCTPPASSPITILLSPSAAVLGSPLTYRVGCSPSEDKTQGYHRRSNI